MTDQGYGTMAHDYGSWPSVLKVKLVGEVTDEIKCSMRGKDCYEIAVAAFQLGCGHRVCGKCRDAVMLKIVNNEPFSCPRTKEDDCEPTTSPLNSDAYIRKQLLKSKIYCPNEGCDQQIMWKAIDDHVGVCEYQLQKCLNEDCEEQIPRKDEKKHKKECRHEPLNCELCGKSSTKAKIQMHLDNDCQENEISCPNGCSESFKRREFGRHNDRCAMKPRPCEYREYGCQFTGNQTALRGHMDEFMPKHLSFLKQAFAIHKENTNKKYTRVNERVSNVERDVAEHGQKVAEATEGGGGGAARAGGDNSRELRNKIDGLKDQMNELRTQVSAAGRSAADSVSQPGQGAGGAPATGGSGAPAAGMTQAEKDHLSTLERRLQFVETGNFDGYIIWRIYNYQELKRKAVSGEIVSVYSQPFYSSRYGYKMCARLYINGDGAGKGSHASLFFAVMKGDFDPLLKWPFQLQVKFTLLDQDGSGKDVKDAFKPDPTSNSFKRPNSKMNVASGCPKFVPHRILEKKPYLVDDVFFLRIEVDTKVGYTPL